MDRRTCLAALGSGLIGVLAGCAADAPGGAADGSSSSTSPPTDPQSSSSPSSPSSSSPSSGPAVTPPESTPAPDECRAGPLPRPSTDEGLPEPRAYPNGPPDLTESAVGTFLDSFEAAYRYNRRLAEVAETGNCLRNLDVYVAESTVWRVEDGFTAEVVTRGSSTGATCPDTTGTDTPTPLPHADFAPEAARYYLTGRFLLRNDIAVTCW